MPWSDNGHAEALYHQSKYGGELYESPSGWGVRNTFIAGSSKKGSIIPIMYYGEGYGGPSRQMFESSSIKPAAGPGYWDRVGADFAKLPTNLVQNLVVDPVKAVAGGAGDIAKGAVGDASEAGRKAIWELAKGLALPFGIAVAGVAALVGVAALATRGRDVKAGNVHIGARR